MSKIVYLKPKKPPLPKIGIIVQARMTSVRFPGKSMALLLDKPVLQWVLERALRIRGPKRTTKEVIVAVPDTDESEPMLALADKLGISNFCGSELNVLDRFYRAGLFFKFDYIMRITADCPFIDPIVCSQVLQLLIWRKLDYASNIYPKRTYPQGLDCEAFSMDCLEAAYKLSNVMTNPRHLYDAEHVTPWMQRNKEIIKGNIEQKIDKSKLNWCVDYPEDIERLENEIRKNEIKLIGDNDDTAI